MRWLTICCVLVAACSSGDSSSATRTPTSARSDSGVVEGPAPQSTPSPSATSAAGRASGVVEGPMPQSAALSVSEGVKQFVLDRDTGQIWTIRGGGATGWADDTTLIAPFYPRGIRLLRLDGGSTYLDKISPTAGVPPVSTASADGEWQLTKDGDTAYIEETSGGRRIVVPTNPTYAWSPRGHVLVTGGGRCANFPIVFVDPDSDPRAQTVDLEGRITRSYQWSPDGRGIALAVILKSAPTESQILFVSAADASVDVLVPVGQAKLVGGEPIVGPWSPSGSYLLFDVYFGRPCPY